MGPCGSVSFGPTKSCMSCLREHSFCSTHLNSKISHRIKLRLISHGNNDWAPSPSHAVHSPAKQSSSSETHPSFPSVSYPHRVGALGPGERRPPGIWWRLGLLMGVTSSASLAGELSSGPVIGYLCGQGSHPGDVQLPGHCHELPIICAAHN